MFLIIQARMTSTRMRGKVMLPLCDATVLEMMLLRLERFKAHIIIATTNEGTQRPIVELCERLHVRFFEGDTDDVLGRYYAAATHFGAKAGDVIVRATSDCPFIDAQLLSSLLALHGGDGYACIDIERSYPRGLDAEVFNFTLLDQAHREARDMYEREHVTPYIRSLDIPKRLLTQTDDDSAFRLTLDTPEDYEVIRRLYGVLGCRSDFGYATLREALYAHPDITALNAHIEQKKR